MGFCAHRRRETCGRRLTARQQEGFRLAQLSPEGRPQGREDRGAIFRSGITYPADGTSMIIRDPRPRAGAAVTSGPHAPAGTRAPGRVCRRWSNHDALVSSLVQPRHSDRREPGFRTWRAMPRRPVAMITNAGTLRGARYDPIVGLMAQLDQALNSNLASAAARARAWAMQALRYHRVFG